MAYEPDDIVFLPFPDRDQLAETIPPIKLADRDPLRTNLGKLVG